MKATPVKAKLGHAFIRPSLRQMLMEERPQA
jgi:hypothetical protein